MTDVVNESGELDGTYDVVVVGSGAAGLAAALAAAVSGVRVVVLEAAERFGGTTAVSGGQAWLPGNHHNPEPDSMAAARTYCLDHSPGRHPGPIEAFLTSAGHTARFLEDHSPLRFTAMDSPDSFAEHPGGRRRGRNLEVAPVATEAFTPWAQWTWSPPYPAVLTNREVAEYGLMTGGAPPMQLIEDRMRAGEVTLGVGLIIGLLRGCRDLGVHLTRRARVLELEHPGDDPGRGVAGVLVGCDDGRRGIRARRGVVLATGGFEHDPEMARRLLDLPDPVPASPPTGRGDGLRLAGPAGAMLGHLSESWCWPVLVSGRTWEDEKATPAAELVIAERTLPHVIWVNSSGRRFVNEAGHNCALSFTEVDPSTNRPRNLPAFAVGDARYRQRYPLAGAGPDEPVPPSVVQNDTLAGLAADVGVDPAGLEAAVARFNQAASQGRDPDFGRGEAAYDRALGDPDATHPNLGTIETPPFFAMPVLPGLVGTKGGPCTDDDGQVLDWDTRPIPGLFAAGNAADSVIGPGILSSGMTLGLALTWGRRAGTAAASREGGV